MKFQAFILLVVPAHALTSHAFANRIRTAPRASSPTMLIEPLEPFTTQAAQALAGYVPAVGPYTEYVADVLEVYAGYTVLSFVLKFVLQALLTATLGAASSIDTVGRNKYDLGSKLGGGSYGSVALDTTGSVVIKTSNRQPRAKDFAKAELEMNQKLKLCGQSGVTATGLECQRPSCARTHRAPSHQMATDRVASLTVCCCSSSGDGRLRGSLYGRRRQPQPRLQE